MILITLLFYEENILKCQPWLPLGYGIMDHFFYSLFFAIFSKSGKSYMEIFDKENKHVYLEEVELLF